MLRCSERQDTITPGSEAYFIGFKDDEKSPIGRIAISYLELDRKPKRKHKCKEEEESGFDFYECVFDSSGHASAGKFLFSISGEYTGIALPLMEMKYFYKKVKAL